MSENTVTLAHGAGGKQTSELIEKVFKAHFSNPEFTASVLACCARAVYKLAKRGEHGCKTVLDIAPAELSALSGEELREKML